MAVAVDQRGRILDAALRLMAEQGSAGASMRQLAAACELNVATLYHYFPSKADLLESVVRERRYGERLAEDAPPLDPSQPPRERLVALLVWLWANALDEEVVWRLLVGEAVRGETAATAAAAEVVELLGASLETWLTDGFPELDGDRAAVARVVRGQVFALVVEHLAVGAVTPATARQRAEELAAALLSARRETPPVQDPVARWDDLVARDRAVLWHPYAAMPAALPPVPVISASGTRLHLADGRELVDGMSSWWAAIHGYRHPVLDEALQRQAGEMAHVMFGGITHPVAVELAERLVEISPPGLSYVFLCDSGSVAVEVAMKMAVQHWLGRGRPGRHRMLTVRGGYHGDTLHAMSVCDPVTGMHQMFSGILPAQLFAPAPSPAYGEAFDSSHIAELTSLIHDHRDEIAAVILEPVVQGAGGMRFYAPEYLQALRRLCDETGALLVFDEIATGFGRTGELFGADHARVSPDIACLGKAMTGGYLSMAAVLCSPSVAEHVCAAEPGALMHGPTYMGNPLAAAVALASIDLLLDQPWQREIARIEARLRTALAPASAAPSVADVRVLGAIGVVETTEALPMEELQAVFLEHEVWLRPFGRLVYTMPPYITTDGEIDRIGAAIVDALRRVAPAPAA